LERDRAQNRYPLLLVALRLRSSPPKRLFGLVHDVAAGNADIVQVAVGPLGQFPTVPLALVPRVDGFLDLRPETCAMIIYHRLV
jgi:hypothetical protein